MEISLVLNVTADFCARASGSRTALFWVKFGMSCPATRQGVLEPIVWDGSESLYCTVGGC